MPASRLNRRHVIAGAAGAAVATLCRAALAQDVTIHRGGVPMVALPELPDHVDEADTDRWVTAWLRSLTYDAPLRVLSTGNIIPAVGIGLGLERGARTVALWPRSGVMFSTGAPMTTVDLAASIERAIDTTTAESDWRWRLIDAIDIDGDRVHLRLSDPDATLPASLTGSLVAVTPHGAPIASLPPDRWPPGTGPFTPYRAEGGEIRFHANRAHWVIGQPRFDGCVVTGVSNAIERTSRLVTGLVDIVPDVPSLDVPLLDTDPGVEIVGDLSRRQCAMVLNLTDEPLNDVRVRQAIAAAIDRDALVAGATAGTGVASSTLFPTDHWAGLPDHAPDGARAPGDTREALAALGLLPGWSLRMICPDNQPMLANTAILLQEQFGEGGIALEIELLDHDALAVARDAGAFQLMMTHLPLWVDPHEIAYPWLHSEGARNAGGFASMRVDRLLSRARTQPETTVRGALYGDIQRIVLDQLPLVPLFATSWIDAVRARTAGYTERMPPSARGIASAWFERP